MQFVFPTVSTERPFGWYCRFLSLLCWVSYSELLRWWGRHGFNHEGVRRNTMTLQSARAGTGQQWQQTLVLFARGGRRPGPRAVLWMCRGPIRRQKTKQGQTNSASKKKQNKKKKGPLRAL